MDSIFKKRYSHDTTYTCNYPRYKGIDHTRSHSGKHQNNKQFMFNFTIISELRVDAYSSREIVCLNDSSL